MLTNPASELAWSLVALIALGALVVLALRVKVELSLLGLNARLLYVKAVQAYRIRQLSRRFGCRVEDVKCLLDRDDFDEVMARLSAELGRLVAEKAASPDSGQPTLAGAALAKVARTDDVDA